MDDFEYSVEISNRDWASFFVECEECDLLPPSLAGVDDSGMSDIDDHFLAQKAQRVNSTTRLSENDLPVDSTPDSEGSPVERSFGKPGIGGIDSVLSGSEEDIHMQSINVFFEKLKGLTEVQPSQERAGNNKEAMQEEERCGDGQQAIRRTSPKTCPEFNMLPERGETGGGKETVRSVDTIRTSKTIAEAESSFSSSTSILCRSKPAETELFIKVETVGNELTQLNQCHNSTEQVVWSEITPQSDKEELCRSMENSGLLTSQEIHSKKWSREDQVFTQETSPSVSMKRKRRKKRRLSAEVCEDEEECDGRVFVKQVGSKEEPHRLREGASLCLSKETFDYLREPQKSPKCLCAPNPATIKLQRSASPSDAQNQHLYQRRSTAVSSAEKLSAQHRPEGHPSRSEGDVTSAAISSGNEAADLQPCSKLQVEESAGRNLPVSATENPKSQPQNAGTGDLHQSDETQNSVRDCKNEQNPKYSTAPVKAVGLLTNTESCAPGVQVSQNDNLSAAKSVLAAEAGNSCRDKRTLCRSEAEPQQQLENDCHDTNQCHAALEHAHCPVSAADEVTSPSMTRSAPHETSDEVTCNDLTSGRVHQLPVSHLSKNQSGIETEQETDHPLEVQASDILLKKDIKVERTQLKPSQTTDSTRQNPETKGSLSENVQTSPSVVTYVSSCCALDSESIISTEPTNQTESSTKKVSSKGEETFAASKQPEKTGNSVYAMSSFWNEMEKLTINDILGLRQISKAAPPLPPVQEREETEMFPVADSGFFKQVDESKPEQITEEVIDSSALRCVSWECEPAPVSRGSVVYTETLTSVSDTSQPVLTERTLNCLRKISKTVSVHNLQALESEPFSYTSKNETMNVSEERESESFVCIPEDAAPKKEKETNVLPSSSTGSYSISFADIFQYLFGGKQSVSSQSATDDKETFYTSGSSVPETYDQFFSEYDDENFFYPLRTAEEKNKDQLVPIFSYSRSACRNLQFPEAYEHFFASSSSDDSSVESDEEDRCRPVRVVSRFTRKASSTQLSKDTYEDFFSDKDLKENFFSLKSLSFRKMNSTAPTVQNQSSNSLVPVNQSPRYAVKVGSRLNVLGNQDGVFPDPLLDHLENRITHQLTQQPFRYEDLQATASNPRSDAPLLPLKQSDMCLVCIAFASWVLKTANPQVGDAWKAVLLANVSALSAIRYLRKYVRVEAAASEIKPHQKALKDS